MIPIAHPLLGTEEENAVLRVLVSGQLAQGKHVTVFEQHFAEVCHVREATERLSGSVQTPVSRPGYRHVYHQYTIRVPENREEWAMHLRARGIGTAVHYPLPTHQQPLYEEEIDKSKFPGAPGTTNARCMTGDVSLPVTELAAKQVLSLPVYPALSGKDPSTITRGGYGLYATKNSSHQRRRGIVWKV